jgi:hypothetical protein
MGREYPRPMTTSKVSVFAGKELSMTIQKPMKKIAFAEKDENFVKQLAKDIGCHYSKANERTYSLNKSSSGVQGEMGAFAWVHKEEKDYFWVTTRKIWIEQARTKADAGKKALKIGCLPRDTQHAEDSVCFDTRDSYQNTISSLRMINKIR